MFYLTGPYADLAQMAMAQQQAAIAVSDSKEGPRLDLWMVVEIKKENFSEKIEFDEELGVFLAPEGKFVGFALTRHDVDEMTTAKLHEVETPGEIEGTTHTELASQYVYLTYKAELKGAEALKKLLGFLVSEGMLKPQT